MKKKKLGKVSTQWQAAVFDLVYFEIKISSLVHYEVALPLLMLSLILQPSRVHPLLQSFFHSPIFFVFNYSISSRVNINIVMMCS